MNESNQHTEAKVKALLKTWDGEASRNQKLCNVLILFCAPILFIRGLYTYAAEQNLIGIVLRDGTEAKIYGIIQIVAATSALGTVFWQFKKKGMKR
ncbi:MAG: hypothetical protein ACSHYA_04370 [Opitutaceae bacterium]